MCAYPHEGMQVLATYMVILPIRKISGSFVLKGGMIAAYSLTRIRKPFFV